LLSAIADFAMNARLRSQTEEPKTSIDRVVRRGSLVIGDHARLLQAPLLGPRTLP